MAWLEVVGDAEQEMDRFAWSWEVPRGGSVHVRNVPAVQAPAADGTGQDAREDEDDEEHQDRPGDDHRDSRPGHGVRAVGVHAAGERGRSQR